MMEQQQYERTVEQSRQLAQRMRNGTGAAQLLQAQDAPTHHMDSLQRFQKDFAHYQRHRRDSQNYKRQQELERKRVEILSRENQRWENVDNQQQKIKDRAEYNAVNQLMGVKRSGNSNGLAYNPITLQYDRNPQGLKLKQMDEDSKIRGYVRAHNMQNKGDSKYNPLNGEHRVGIDQLVPQNLVDRFQKKKYDHYDLMKLKVPSDNELRPHSYSKYY